MTADLTPTALAGCIDHTLLKAEATAEQIETLCAEALHWRFAAVCVNPVHVARAVAAVGKASNAAEPAVAVASVVGFPLGATPARVKACEAEQACADGAGEIDMVVNLGALIDGRSAEVAADIAAVAKVVHAGGAGRLLKVILETAALTPDQIELGCRCAREAGADYVKTSTGFHPAGGATVAHVALLRRAAAPLRVKASGGIRDLAAARAMLSAGADRLGTSSGVRIVEEAGADPSSSA